MSALDDLRRIVANALTALAGGQAFLIVIIGAGLGRSAVTEGIVAAILAFIPLLLAALKRPARIVGLSVAVALIGQTALLVEIFAGHPWQIEMHFYFFAVLAMLAGFCDVAILLVAASLIAIHHIVLDGFFPDALYPDGGSLIRLSVHAMFVVVETTMLIVIAHVIGKSFMEASAAKEMAQATSCRLESLGGRLEVQLGEKTARAHQLEQHLTTFKAEMSESLAYLLASSQELDAGADYFARASEETTTQAVAVSTAADGANLRVRNVAGAGREYLGTMSVITEHTYASTQMGKVAAAEIEATMTTIYQLKSMSAQIDGSVKLIAAIADQTNLLALNATIEAARAGEHGRGFSVVAGEVKALASQTTQAATLIAETVNTIQGSTKRSAEAMNSIVGSMRNLNITTASIADAVEERTQVAADMATDAEAAAEDVQKVTSAVETIRIVAFESAKGATHLRHAANELAEQTATIRARIDKLATALSSIGGGSVSCLAPDRPHTKGLTQSR